MSFVLSGKQAAVFVICSLLLHYHSFFGHLRTLCF